MISIDCHLKRAKYIDIEVHHYPPSTVWSKPAYNTLHIDAPNVGSISLYLTKQQTKQLSDALLKSTQEDEDRPASVYDGVFEEVSS